MTPNLLARTVETVEGGGLVVLLLSNLKSLTQLYTLTMDSHARLRTESHQVRRKAMELLEAGGPKGGARPAVAGVTVAAPHRHCYPPPPCVMRC